jgi:hypothetical protein
MVRRILRKQERLRDEGHDILKPVGAPEKRKSKLEAGIVRNAEK